MFMNYQLEDESLNTYSSVREVTQQLQSFCWIQGCAKFQSTTPVHKKRAVMRVPYAETIASRSNLIPP